jgi:S-adenosylmethionine synthetase
VAREAIRKIGYTDREEPFCADTATVHQFITEQSSDIDLGVSAARNSASVQGAGDQGMMFGFATKETPELMPLPIMLAHKMSRLLAEDRKSNRCEWMRPDGKTQVSVRYADGKPVEVTTVVISIHHRLDVGRVGIERYVRERVLPTVLGDWYRDNINLHVNPTGQFVVGGPMADSGLTGRKIIVDTYGGAARHGGGSFSGKDASKVDRSGAYFGRFIAQKLVLEGICDQAEIEVAYAIGCADPVSVWINTFDSGNGAQARKFVEQYDFRPGAIIERLNLTSPLFSKSTNYGHFGKKGLPWEIH